MLISLGSLLIALSTVLAQLLKQTAGILNIRLILVLIERAGPILPSN